MPEYNPLRRITAEQSIFLMNPDAFAGLVPEMLSQGWVALQGHVPILGQHIFGTCHD